MPCWNPCRNIALTCICEVSLYPWPCECTYPQGMNVSGCSAGRRTNEQAEQYEGRYESRSARMQQVFQIISEAKQCQGGSHGQVAARSRSFMPHMYMAFWFDKAKAFGKCNLQRSAQSSNHFATRERELTHNRGQLVNFSRSHQATQPQSWTASPATDLTPLSQLSDWKPVAIKKKGSRNL